MKVAAVEGEMISLVSSATHYHVCQTPAVNVLYVSTIINSDSKWYSLFTDEYRILIQYLEAPVVAILPEKWRKINRKKIDSKTIKVDIFLSFVSHSLSLSMLIPIHIKAKQLNPIRSKRNPSNKIYPLLHTPHTLTDDNNDRLLSVVSAEKWHSTVNVSSLYIGGLCVAGEELKWNKNDLKQSVFMWNVRLPLLRSHGIILRQNRLFLLLSCGGGVDGFHLSFPLLYTSFFLPLLPSCCDAHSLCMLGAKSNIVLQAERAMGGRFSF